MRRNAWVHKSLTLTVIVATLLGLIQPALAVARFSTTDPDVLALLDEQSQQASSKLDFPSIPSTTSYLPDAFQSAFPDFSTVTSGRRGQPSLDPLSDLNFTLPDADLVDPLVSNPLSKLPESADQNAPFDPIEAVGRHLLQTTLLQPGDVSMPGDQRGKFNVYLPLVLHGASRGVEISPESGGSIVSSDEQFTAVFAPGAVDTLAEGYWRGSKALNLPASAQIIGSALELAVSTQSDKTPILFFAPNITTQNLYNDEFEQWQTIYAVTPTVKITAMYRDAQVAGLDESRLGIYRQDPVSGAWKAMPSIVDTKDNVVYASVERDGVYALLGQRTKTMATTGIRAMDEKHVVIDPDHGGSNPGGTVSYPSAFSTQEKIHNLEVALLLRDLLIGCGLKVDMTRETDISLSTTDRASIINTKLPDAAVTIAFNVDGAGFMQDFPGGPMGLIDFDKPADMVFAQAINAEVHNFTGLTNHRGVRDADTWAWCGGNCVGSHVPDVLYSQSELAFLDSYTDRAFIDEHPETFAAAVFTAIVDQLGGPGICTPGFEFPEPLSPEERARLRNLGYQNWLRYRRDPVASTGNHVQRFTDLQIPGIGLDFSLNRTYNSFDEREGVFGYGWSSILDTYLRLARDGSVDVRMPDGSGFYFEADGEGYVPEQGGVFYELARNGSDLMLASPDQVFYHFEVISSTAQLTRINDRFGNTIAFERNEDGQITSITDTAGRVYTLTYDGDYVASISDLTGRKVEYGYQNGDLVSVTDGNGGTNHFEYTDHLLTKLRDPEDIVYLENVYDSERRVVDQTDASGNHNYANYSTGDQTVVDDNAENQITDVYDELDRVIETVDAEGYSEKLVYDDYNVSEYTDKNGNTWKYTYDERGNLLTITDPDSKTTTYTYNEDNDLTSVTDALGRTTTFVWVDGTLIRVERPDGTDYMYTYNDRGQMRTVTDPNGHTVYFDYDSQGNLAEIRSPEDNVSNYAYDAVGRMVKMVDANSHTMRIVYDGNDNITRLVDPKAQFTAFAYDGNDMLVKMVDRRGGVWQYTYDENLKLKSETDPEGHTTTYQYDEMYNRISSTDPNGNTTFFRYNKNYWLTEVEDALGNITEFEYDPNGNLTKITDAQGYGTKLEYDDLNRMVKIVDALDGITEFGYDAVGRLLKTVNPRGAVTRYTYDDVDQLVLVTDALDGKTAYAYDPAGNLIAITDANNHTTHLDYDEDDRLVTRQDPGAHVTRFGYDGVGNLVKLTNPRGYVTTYAYDENDNLILITDAMSGESEYAYDEEDALIAITDPNGHTTRFAYDLDGLMVKLTEAGGQVTHFEFDAAHNLIRLINAKGNIYTFSYDALNRQTTVTDPLDYVTAYTYDELSHLVAVTDAESVITSYEYDPLDRLTAVVQNYLLDELADHETNVRTEYTYDPVGNLTDITDANGNVTQFSYDLLDRLIREVNPIANIWRYEYDPVGNLTRRIDANGAITNYVYDVDDLLVKIAYPDGSKIRFGYDANHNQVQMMDGLGTTTNAYDALDRLTASTNHLGQRVGYTYDAASNRTAVIYPDDRVVRTEYDETNYPVRVIDPDDNVFKATYDPTHNITHLLNPNLTEALMTYDAADRLTSVVNRQLDGDLISSYTYEMDQVGNRVHSDEYYRWRQPREMSHDYVYDSLYRLVQSQDSEDRLTQYAYDAVGNRLQMVSNYDPLQTPTDRKTPYTVDYTYNAANQLLATDHSDFGVTNYTYDANDNRIRREGPDVWVGNPHDTLRTDYTYDYENRLASVKNYFDSGNGKWSLRDESAMNYDGYGRLFRRMHDMHQGGGGQKWVDFVYDGLDPIVEYVDPSPQYDNYYRGFGRILEMHEFKSQQSPDGTAYYYHYDGLGSVSALTKHQGQSAHTYRYGDYGMALDKNDGTADSSNFINPHNHYTYTGQNWDDENALYHFYAREYDPITGTWLQQDPYRGRLAEPMTLHRYGYVGGNPVNYTDWYGFWGINIGLKSWGGLGGGIGLDISLEIEFEGWKVKSIGLPIEINIGGETSAGADASFDFAIWDRTKTASDLPVTVHAGGQGYVVAGVRAGYFNGDGKEGGEFSIGGGPKLGLGAYGSASYQILDPIKKVKKAYQAIPTVSSISTSTSKAMDTIRTIPSKVKDRCDNGFVFNLSQSGGAVVRADPKQDGGPAIVVLNPGDSTSSKGFEDADAIRISENNWYKVGSGGFVCSALGGCRGFGFGARYATEEENKRWEAEYKLYLRDNGLQ